MNLRRFLAGPAVDALLRYWWAIPLLALALLWWRSDSLRAGYKQQRDDVRQEYAAFRKEITDRTTAALAKEKEQARAADQHHAKELADARSATDRYIAANRVRKPGNCHSPAPASSVAGVSQEVPTLVVMDQADVRACGDLYAYALEAHRWALSLDKVE